MFCINCGKEIDDKAKFCPHCGSQNDFKNDKAQGTSDLGESSNIQQQVPEVTQSTPPQVNHQYNQSAGNTYQTSNVQPASLNRQAKPEAANKRLKTIFFILLGVSAVLAVAAVILSGGGDSSDDIGAILTGEPKVEDEVFEDWGKGEYSLNSIGDNSIESKSIDGSSSADTQFQYNGVWQLKGLKMNLKDTKYSISHENDADMAYLVIDDNDTVHSIVTDNAGIALSHRQTGYRIESGKFISDAGDNALEGAYLQYELADQILAVCTMIGDVQSSDWAIYEKTGYDVDYMLGLAAAIQETDSMVQTSYEIEQQMLGAWEADLKNIGVYYGCEFRSDGTFWYIETADGELITDTVYAYEIISPNEMILAGNSDAVFNVYSEYSSDCGHDMLYITSDTDIMELGKVNSLNPPDIR